jgi:hypothetical protein
MAMLAPIPGQSLTDEPQNFAWERPPEIVDPNDAVKYHMDRLSEKPVAESALFLLEFGFPADILTRSMLTGAVGEGVHSIDVSVLVAPVIEEELGYMARTAGIEYKDTFAADQTEDELQEEQLRMLLRKKLDDNLGKGDESFSREAISSIGSDENDDLEAMQASMEPQQEEAMPQVMPEVMAEPMPAVEEEAMMEEVPTPVQGDKGLMSRGV